MVNNLPLHHSRFLCVACPLACSFSFFCDRQIPTVFQATDKPICCLRFVLIASCAHVQ